MQWSEILIHAGNLIYVYLSLPEWVVTSKRNTCGSLKVMCGTALHLSSLLNLKSEKKSKGNVKYLKYLKMYYLLPCDVYYSIYILPRCSPTQSKRYKIVKY